jgi:hypothetical protein
MSITVEDIRGAVARGWTHTDTERLEMDVVLAEAITSEIAALLAEELAIRLDDDNGLCRAWIRVLGR